LSLGRNQCRHRHPLLLGVGGGGIFTAIFIISRASILRSTSPPYSLCRPEPRNSFQLSYACLYFA
jgi:hypothetical protein